MLEERATMKGANLIGIAPLRLSITEPRASRIKNVCDRLDTTQADHRPYRVCSLGQRLGTSGL